MKRHLRITSLLHRAAALAVLLVLSSCAGLGRSLVEPDVSITGVRLEEAHLNGAELLFEFEVDNPNAVGLVLDALDYRLRLNGRQLLDGRRDRRLEIPANGESRVELPVTIRYADILQVIDSFDGRRGRRPDYELEADFRFDAPILGAITVPVRERGDIPLDRLQGFLDRFGRR
jgi:LEA14-like dessication related protein